MNWFKRKKKKIATATEDEKNDIVQGQSDAKERDLSLERMVNIKICEQHGFTVSKGLPYVKSISLRPKEEIAARLHAIKAMVLWAMVPEDKLPSDVIFNFIERNDLHEFLTVDEKQIFETQRDDQELRNSIGWKFENSWPLAWYFGYDSPQPTGIMMTGEQMQDILANHTCPIDGDVLNWVETKKTEDVEQLIMYEDLFYCIHNAVRSAQIGGDTIPQGFHPVGNGGVIHERRHALTWMLSKGVDWDNTDLST